MTAATRRPVRVTLEGEAYRPVPGHDNVLMVVLPNDHKVCLTEGPGITVEDIVPPRVWTDGDALQGAGYIYGRRGGKWFPAHGARSVGFSDELVNRDVEAGSLTVLRYQAGDA